MSSFRSSVADREALDTFRSCLQEDAPGMRKSSHNTLPLHLFEWMEDAPTGSESSGLKSIADLELQNQAVVRIVFAPRDVPSPATIDSMCELFERQKIPSAFIAESLQNVSQSFSVQRDKGTTIVFFHLLVKTVATSNGQIVLGNDQEMISRTGGLPQSQSQANFTWVKLGVVLRIRHGATSPSLPSRTRTSSSESTLIPCMEPEVDMFCFGASLTLRDRFQKLKNAASCKDILSDPYILLEAVLGDMYKVMDQTGWAIADIFGKIEARTLEMAKTPGRVSITRKLLDFQGLHNLAKHNIYLRENCESALATLDDLRDHHKATYSDHPSPAQEATRQALKYQKTLFQSTQRRLESLDRRVGNIIQLSFNIVTQGDSRLMQSESQSMKTIAVMTLIFMPLSTVASVFGTEFMRVEDEPGHRILVSQDFWLLWAIAAPLTIVVIVLWRVWYADAKGRLIDEIPGDAERRMGWKTIRQTLLGSETDGKAEYSVTTREVSADGKV